MVELTHKQCGSPVKVISGIFTKNPSVKCKACNLIIPLASDEIGKYHANGEGSEDCNCRGCTLKREGNILCSACNKVIDCEKGYYNYPWGPKHLDCSTATDKSVAKAVVKALVH